MDLSVAKLRDSLPRLLECCFQKKTLDLGITRHDDVRILQHSHRYDRVHVFVDRWDFRGS